VVKKLGLQKDICNKEYLTRFFNTFYMEGAGIESLDAGLLDFVNLEILNLSHNKITELDFISPNLKELSLTANNISFVKVPKSESLIHLSLSYNPIDDQQLINITRCFPNLFSLDLANTQVQSLATVVNCLNALRSLKMVSFKGSPVCLSKDYRKVIKQRFQQLKMLDGVVAFSEAEEALKKKKKKKFDAYGNEIVDTSGLCAIDPEVRLDIKFGLLSNVSGVYIKPEHIPEEYDLTPLAPTQKSSFFHIEFVDYSNQRVKSEPRVWISDFSIDKESGGATGKCDLQYELNLCLENGVDTRVHEWLKQDVFVELYHTRPVIKEVKQEDDTVEHKVQFKQDEEVPECETNCIGVSSE
jgi:hypothetical protein